MAKLQLQVAEEDDELEELLPSEFSCALWQFISSKSNQPSPSLSILSLHWVTPSSLLSSGKVQPPSWAKSILPSPSLSIPSRHCGTGEEEEEELELLLVLELLLEELLEEDDVDEDELCVGRLNSSLSLGL